MKDITKGKMESLLDNFTAIFCVISYITLGKTEYSGSNVKSSLHHKKELVET